MTGQEHNSIVSQLKPAVWLKSPARNALDESAVYCLEYDHIGKQNTKMQPISDASRNVPIASGTECPTLDLGAPKCRSLGCCDRTSPGVSDHETLHTTKPLFVHPGICICFLSKNCSADSLSQVAGQIPFCTPTESAFEDSKQTNFVLWPAFLISEAGELELLKPGFALGEEQMKPEKSEENAIASRRARQAARKTNRRRADFPATSRNGLSIATSHLGSECQGFGDRDKTKGLVETKVT
jgi:hypothetical protein